MTIDFLSELARDEAEVNRLRTRTLNLLVDAMALQEVSSSFREEVAWAAQEVCDSIAERGLGTAKMATQIIESLRQPRRPQAARLLLGLAGEMLADWLALEKTYHQFRSAAEQLGVHLPAATTQALDGAITEIRRAEKGIAEMMTALHQPPRPVDLGRLAEGLRAADEKRTVSSSELIARVRAARG